MGKKDGLSDLTQVTIGVTQAALSSLTVFQKLGLSDIIISRIQRKWSGKQKSSERQFSQQKLHADTSDQMEMARIFELISRKQ